MSVDMVKLRAWWAHRQGLDGRLVGGAPAEVLKETGWARSVGGCGPYLGLFARAGTGRAAVDKAVAEARIHELPSARGCTYVVPAAHYALALKIGGSFPEGEMNVAKKLGVTEKEVERLCDAVCKAVGKEALEPESLKEAVGDAVRNLGEAGKKKGLTTTLPLALGRLQARGEIRRIPVNGRLDQQRYRYARWGKNPLRGFDQSAEDCFAALARLYFGWIAPATVGEFAQFAGLGVGAARKAVESLRLVPLEAGSDWRMPLELRERYAAFMPPREPQLFFISSLDGLMLHRRAVMSLVLEEDAGSSLWEEVGAAAFRTAGTLKDLPCHAIVDRGRVVGLWEYDVEARQIVWAALSKLHDGVREAVKCIETYVRNELGDARSFSLDSPKSRAPRLKALRRRMK